MEPDHFWWEVELEKRSKEETAKQNPMSRHGQLDRNEVTRLKRLIEDD